MVNHKQINFKASYMASRARSMGKMAEFNREPKKLKMVDFMILAVLCSCVVLAVGLLAVMLHAVSCPGG